MAVLMRLPLHGGDLVAEHGIVRADEVQRVLTLIEAERLVATQVDALLARAEADAREIVATAQQSAREVLASAEVQVEAARREAYERSEAQAAAEWHERQAAMAEARAASARAMHEKLAEVVMTAVERIVQSEGRAALFKRALRSVQSLAKGATALTLRVSMIDEAAATSSVAALLEQHPQDQPLTVIVDPSLAPGSCIFESETGVLDASLQTQLDALRAAMGRAVRRAIDSESQAAPTADGGLAPTPTEETTTERDPP